MGKNLKSIAGTLSDLTDEELITVIYEAFSKRIPYKAESEYCHSRYFVGIASQDDESDIEGVQEWSEWSITAIAKPDPIEYAIDKQKDLYVGADWGFCQGGKCQNCGFEVSSNMKHGICQVCEKKVYMT